MIDSVKLARLQGRAVALWREVRFLLVFILLMIAFRSAIADWSDVPTGSMKPTIIEGDRIFVNKMAYDIRVPLTHRSLLRRADPRRGDIIIFDSAVSELRLVKRVIGVPGDVVELRSNVVFVNGQSLAYRRVVDSGASGEGFDVMESLAPVSSSEYAPAYTVRLSEGGALSNFPAVTVPDGFYFVLGDNRDNSADSRVIGFVPRHEIVGRSSSVVLSLDYERYYRPRTERFFHTF